MEDKGNSKVERAIILDPNRDETQIDKEGKIITKISTYSSEAEFKLYAMVIALLGGIVILTVIAVFVLSLNGKDISDAVIGMGSVAIGALAGVLAPSPAKPSTQTTTATPPTPPTPSK